MKGEGVQNADCCTKEYMSESLFLCLVIGYVWPHSRASVGPPAEIDLVVVVVKLWKHSNARSRVEE